MCFWRCGGIAHVRDGKLWKFEGNPKDPQSHGRLCPRGTGAVGAHYDPDRSAQPLIRVGERGKEQWKAVTWDEALGLHRRADGQDQGRARRRVDRTVQPRLRPALHPARAEELRRHQRTPARRMRSAAARATSASADLRRSGVGSPEPTDIQTPSCLVLIGSHLGENMHNSQVQEFAQAIERRVPVIVVDPRFSVAASKAKYWLPVKPGTDLALLLAWMNLLVSEGRYDKAFVDQYGHGFDKFAAEIKGYTVEWAAEETGVRAEPDPSRGARVRQPPAGHDHSPGPPRQLVRRRHAAQSRDRAAVRAARQLGPQGRTVPGRGHEDRRPTRCRRTRSRTSPRPTAPTARSYPFADEGITTSIRDATLSEKPYPIKGWFVYSTNLMQALPNRQETLKAIDQLDLLVVCETIPSEIAGLRRRHPARHRSSSSATTNLLIGYGRVGWTSLRQPVVARRTTRSRPGGSPSNWPRSSASAPACRSRTWRSTCRTRVEKSGHSWETLKKEGVIMGTPKPITVDDGTRARVRHAVEARSSSGPTSWPRPASTRCRSTRGTTAGAEGPLLRSSPGARRCTPSAARRATRCCRT